MVSVLCDGGRFNAEYLKLISPLSTILLGWGNSGFRTLNTPKKLSHRCPPTKLWYPQLDKQSIYISWDNLKLCSNWSNSKPKPVETPWRGSDQAMSQLKARTRYFYLELNAWLSAESRWGSWESLHCGSSGSSPGKENVQCNLCICFLILEVAEWLRTGKTAA